MPVKKAKIKSPGGWDAMLDKLANIAGKVDYAISIFKYLASAVRDFPRYRDFRPSEKIEQPARNEPSADPEPLREVQEVDSSTGEA